MTFGDWVSTVLDAVQIAAIVVAAVWAYYKFVRGRVFARRAELAVSGDLLAGGDAEAIRARVSLKNTGASDIPLRNKVIRVHTAARHGWGLLPGWERVRTVAVFEEHERLEAQELISDQVLIPLSGRARAGPPFAYRLEFVVLGHETSLRLPRRRRRRKLIRWSTEAIVPRELRPVVGESTARLDKEAQVDERRDDRHIQRPSDEDEADRLDDETEERQRHADEDEAERLDREVEE